MLTRPTLKTASSPGETDGKQVFLLVAGLTLTVDVLAGGGIVGRDGIERVVSGIGV